MCCGICARAISSHRDAIFGGCCRTNTRRVCTGLHFKRDRDHLQSHL
jgi:hypothetical protein